MNMKDLSFAFFIRIFICLIYVLHIFFGFIPKISFWVLMLLLRKVMTFLALYPVTLLYNHFKLQEFFILLTGIFYIDNPMSSAEKREFNVFLPNLYIFSFF